MHVSRFSAVLGSVAAAAISLAVVALVQGQDAPPRNPDAGLNDQERRALHRELMEKSIVGRAADLEFFRRSGLDLRSLQRVPLEIDYAPPPSALGAAAAVAPVIVHVRIETLEFEAGSEGAIYANLTAEVLNVLKGQPEVERGQDLWVRKLGGPERGPGTTEDRIQFILGENEADPLLFEGSEAVLFLDKGVPAGSWFVQARTGQYALRSGKIEALAKNPFAADVNGLTVSEFEDKLQSPD